MTTKSIKGRVRILDSITGTPKEYYLEEYTSAVFDKVEDSFIGKIKTENGVDCLVVQKVTHENGCIPYSLVSVEDYGSSWVVL